MRHWISSPPSRRYAVAVLCVSGAALATFAISPLLTYRAPALTFTLAVMIAAWHGGLGPGLTATGLGFLVVDYFFLTPIYHFLPVASQDYALLILYTVVGVAISVLTGRLSRGQAEMAAVFSALTDAVVVVRLTADQDIGTSTYVFANDAFAAMFNLERPQSVRLRRVADVFANVEITLPDGSAPAQLPSARVLKGEYVKDLELRFRRRSTGQV